VDAPVDIPPAVLASNAPAPKPVTDGTIRLPDPRCIPLDRMVNAIVGAAICTIHLIFAAVLWVTEGRPAALPVSLALVPVTAFFAWLALRWPRIDYRYRRYRVDATGIEIWSGVVWRQAVVVPRSRVQHIDVSQGPVERSFGLATLSIHTAGTQHSKVELRGLDHAVALAVRDVLLPKDAEPAV
jgi:membrane protein YdbS with pleckstrin-like domain